MGQQFNHVWFYAHVVGDTSRATGGVGRSSISPVLPVGPAFAFADILGGTCGRIVRRYKRIRG